MMSKQKVDNGNSERAAAVEELSDDMLEHMAGGKVETIGIFREYTRHPAKSSVPD